MSDLLLLVPFVAVVLLYLLPKRARTAGLWIAFGILALETAAAFIDRFATIDFGLLAPLGKLLGFHLATDGLSELVILCTGLVGMAALLVARRTLEDENEKFLFANLVLVAVVGINGIAMVRDLFSLYVFVEVTAVATFILIAAGRGDHVFEGAWKYIFLSVVASVLMLTSLGFFLLSTGGITLDAARTGLAANAPLAWIAMALFLCGLFVKGAMVPFHGWLADAYTAAPAPVSVFMAGIVTKASGIFALMRIAQSTLGGATPGREILLVVGAVTIVVGAFLSLTQTNFKRMLAYSSISQMGYIVLALGGDLRLGILAAGLHFFNHAISKSQLFANAAAIEKQLGTLDMDEMGGLGARMPVTAGTSAVASLSIAGLPPLAGFWSKLLIVLALWNAKEYAFAAVAILASLVTLAYFLSLQRRVFFGKPLEKWAGAREASVGLLVPAVALALITIALGVGFPFALKILMGGGA
ncbi:MAG: proton-conducting transporter membrane subunit [Candidatus Bipolaricaulota bacterium]|nr:proton-conducting transporter membrane subunit [Candidatus Bipolaricaulota bacterium]